MFILLPNLFVEFFFEPTDRRKASLALQGLKDRQKITFASPNMSELRAMAKFLRPNLIADSSTILNEIINLSKIVSEYINVLIITLGDKGVATVTRINEHEKICLSVRVYPVTPLSKVENVSGAGDCFSSGFIHGTLLGFEESHCISIGFEAAKHTLLCKQTVPLKFNLQQKIEEAVFINSNYDL